MLNSKQAQLAIHPGHAEEHLGFLGRAGAAAEHHLKPPPAILMERSCRITSPRIESTTFKHLTLTLASLFQAELQMQPTGAPSCTIYTSTSPSTTAFQIWHQSSSINVMQIIRMINHRALPPTQTQKQLKTCNIYMMNTNCMGTFEAAKRTLPVDRHQAHNTCSPKIADTSMLSWFKCILEDYEV